MTKPKLRIGLIGTGFMGKAHVFGFTSAPKVFDLPYGLELHTVADVTAEAAARAAGLPLIVPDRGGAADHASDGDAQCADAWRHQRRREGHGRGT